MLREVKVARRVLVINANQLLQLGNVDPETGEILQEAQAHSGWAWHKNLAAGKLPIRSKIKTPLNIVFLM